jgi:predicted Zn-dependent protease with MMP-like domain
MTRKQFSRAVAEVMQALPPAFAPYLNNLVVDVEDEPSLRLMRDMDFSEEEIADGESLYGLFIPSQFDSGDGLGGVNEHDQPPHRIIIYQRPLEEDFPDRQELFTEIRKTVIHELAHHFGWTDRDLEKFDENPSPFE